MVQEITKTFFFCDFCESEHEEYDQAKQCERDCFDDIRGDEQRDRERDDRLCDEANNEER